MKEPKLGEVLTSGMSFILLLPLKNRPMAKQRIEVILATTQIPTWRRKVPSSIIYGDMAVTMEVAIW